MPSTNTATLPTLPAATDDAALRAHLAHRHDTTGSAATNDLAALHDEYHRNADLHGWPDDNAHRHDPSRQVTVVLFDSSENEVERATMNAPAEVADFVGRYVAAMGLDPDGDTPLAGSIEFWPGTYEDRL